MHGTHTKVILMYYCIMVHIALQGTHLLLLIMIKFKWIFIRWDADVDDTEYLITLKRTLVSLYEDTENDRNGCKHFPLIDIEPDNIIPDELHLLLRITDVLTENLIIAARLHDKRQNRGCKLLEGQMVKALLESIRSCGVSFKIWEKNMPTKEFEFTSLMGNCKKKLLAKLPSKFSSCQPACLIEDVTDLWEVYYIAVYQHACYILHIEIQRNIRSSNVKAPGYRLWDITRYGKIL